MLSVAGLVPRGLAYLVDVSIRTVIYLAGAIGFGIWLGEAALGPILLLIFATEWFYPVAFEVLWGGRTPGKAGLGLRVVHRDGTPIRWPASLLRNLLIAADFLPFSYGFGMASMLCDGQARRLGDLAAGTLVIHSETPEPGAAPALDRRPVAPPMPLTPDEQGAVIAFVERSGALSSERIAELAAIPAALGGNRESLEAVAAHLLGQGGTTP